MGEAGQVPVAGVKRRRTDSEQEKERERPDATPLAALLVKEEEAILSAMKTKESPAEEEEGRAVIKALHWMFQCPSFSSTAASSARDLIGNGIMHSLLTASRHLGERAEEMIQEYITGVYIHWSDRMSKERIVEKPGPREMIEMIIGIHYLKHCGVDGSELKNFILNVQSEEEYSARDVLGWDPKEDHGLPLTGGKDIVSGSNVSVYRLLSSSLLLSHFGEQVGITPWCSFEVIDRHINHIRPYKSPADVAWDAYVDQCHLVTHIIFIASGWGEKYVDPKAYAHEYCFIKAHLQIAMSHRDIQLVANFLRCLNCFGFSDLDSINQWCKRFILESQCLEGQWDDSIKAGNIGTCVTTMSAVQSLLTIKPDSSVPSFSLSEKEKEAMDQQLVMYIQSVSDYCQNHFKQFSDSSLCVSPLDYLSHFGRDTVCEYGNNIFYPVDMDAHVEERLATLKQAVRGFAKKYSSSIHTKKLDSSSLGTESERPSDVVITPSHLELSESDIELLEKLSGLVGSYLRKRSESAPLEEDEEKLLQVLQSAENLPVTASILQSDKFSALAKQVRQISKIKNSKLSVVATSVVGKWKHSILSQSNQDATSPRSN